MVNSLITLYCVSYDPYRCTCDPERIWSIVERSGGSVCAGSVQGHLEFYVPERVITQVMLMDSSLKIRESKSYI